MSTAMLLVGTEAGYDVGGLEPICFSSVLNFTSSSPPFSLSQLNDHLAQEHRSQVDLRPRCPAQFGSLSVKPLFESSTSDVVDSSAPTNNLIMQAGSLQYTFGTRISLPPASDLPSWNDFEVSDETTWIMPTTIYGRLLLCDVDVPSFCHPLVDTRMWDDPGTPDDVESFLLGIPRDRLFIHTEWIAIDVQESGPNDDVEVSLNITMTLLDNVTTALHDLVFHVVAPYLATDETTGATLVARWDVAASLVEGPVQVQASPTIRRVSDAASGVIGFISILCGAYSLFCLCYVLWKRQHPVMKLGQSAFLAVLAFSTLWVFACLFTVLPTKDWHCRAYLPLIYTPLCLVTSILISRMWRVYQTLSVVGKLGRDNPVDKTRDCCTILSCGLQIGKRLMYFLTVLSTVPYWFHKQEQQRMRAGPSLRKAVTAQETVCLIAMLVFPQVIFTVIGTALWKGGIILEFDAGSNEGRYVCDTKDWLLSLNDVYLTLLECAMLIMAWISRELPSAFNEKNQLFQVAGFTIFLNIIASIVAGDYDEASSSPDRLVGVIAAQITIRSMLILILIIQPKINRVWTGKKVVVSNLLRGQTSSETSGDNETPNTTTCLPRVTLQQDDPLPRKVEVRLYDMLNLLRRITSRIGEGRPLRLRDWNFLRDESSQLYGWLRRIDLAWEVSEEPATVRGGLPMLHEPRDVTDVPGVGRVEEGAATAPAHSSEVTKNRDPVEVDGGKDADDMKKSPP